MCQRATEKYNGKVSSAIDISDIIKEVALAQSVSNVITTLDTDCAKATY